MAQPVNFKKINEHRKNHKDLDDYQTDKKKERDIDAEVGTARILA